MTTFAYPSPEFPAFPRFTVDTSDGWIPTASFDTLLGLTGPGGSNVAVKAIRKNSHPDLAEAAEAVLAPVTGEQDYAPFGQENREILGRPGFRHECTYTDTNGEPTFQATHIAVFDYDGFSDIVSLTARCRAVDAATLVPEIRGILASAVVV